MAPLPKKRHSTARKGKRRASIRLSVPSFRKCPKCGHLIKPQQVCRVCGYYKGQDILGLEKKKAARVAQPTNEK